MVKKKSSKIPSYNECHDLDAWHMPWNKEMYKSRCVDEKCIWEKSAMGSKCKDPISVTNENINYNNLNNVVKLAKITRDELTDTLSKCNVVNDKYLKELIKKYTSKRLAIIKDITTYNKNNYLIKCSSDDIYKIVLNAKTEKIKNAKSFDELLNIKEHQKEVCFNSQLGNNKARYKNRDWSEISNILHNCGLYEHDTLYKLARNNWETYNINQDVTVRKIHVHQHINRPNSSRSSRRRNLPKGDWIDTAKNYKIVRNTLYAELKKRNGYYVKSSANLNLCNHFENDNGSFKCVRRIYKSKSRRKRSRRSRHIHIHKHKKSSKKKSSKKKSSKKKSSKKKTSKKKGIFTLHRERHNKIIADMGIFH